MLDDLLATLRRYGVVKARFDDQGNLAEVEFGPADATGDQGSIEGDSWAKVTRDYRESVPEINSPSQVKFR